MMLEHMVNRYRMFNNKIYKHKVSAIKSIFKNLLNFLFFRKFLCFILLICLIMKISSMTPVVDVTFW